MKLSGREYQQLQQALISAFPRRTDLEQMLMFQLGESLDLIVGGGNLADTVFGLIQWAVARGRLGDLIAGAQSANAGNAELRRFVEQVWQTQAANTPVAAPAGSAERARLNELLAIQQSNLHKLERQQALHGGIDVPLSILNQIDEAQREIARLKAQIDAL